MQKLLTARSYADAGEQLGSLYAQGWLLTHYAFINPERNKQLQVYLAAINAGDSYADAAKKGFGDSLDKLDDELQAYSRKGKLGTQQISFKPIAVGDITIRPLNPAENAMIDENLKLSAGVAKSDKDVFIRRVREEAARFPNDPFALSVLTESEHLAGNIDAAKAAVDRWIAVAPRDPMALMFKGEIAVAQLVAAKSTSDAAWDEARAPMLEAATINPNIPRLYKAYYDSFVAEGRGLPPAGAQNGLLRALKLVPNDDGLRYQLAKDFEDRDMIVEAIAVIRPLAYTIKPDSELTPAQRRNRDKAKERFALLGQTDHETPRDMFDRLVAKRDGTWKAESASK